MTTISPKYVESELCYFNDNKRIIDYVLVYRINEANNEMMEYFLTQLQNKGVECEKEIHDEQIFMKIFVPFDLMCKYAELMKLSLPVMVEKTSKRKTLTAKILHLKQEEFETKHVKIPFVNQYKHLFIGINNEETFFSPKHRQKIAFEILSECNYDPNDSSEVGISNLIKNKVFEAAYPLHEPSLCSVRGKLTYEWASFKRIFCRQPFSSICHYFGEHIAMYFSWLGFYTTFLAAAALIGTAVFIYGGASVVNNVPIKEMCSLDYEMCSLCDICKNWRLSEFCLENKIGYLFDHDGTIFFSIFMSFWAITFLEFWKRKSKLNDHLWECNTVDTENKKIRPEYAAKAKIKKKNPVTGNLEPFVKFSQKIYRELISWSFLLSMISVVLISLISVVVYRSVINVLIARNEMSVRKYSKIIASVTGSLISFVIIQILEILYTKLAWVLTEWEMHKTNENFENNLAIKVFAFKFVNFCSPLVYIAFFKGRFSGRPGKYNTLFGVRMEQCSESGCMHDLGIQLAIIMVGTQLINNISEILVPFLKRKIKTHGKATPDMKCWQRDFLLCENPGLIKEYLEMTLQFGLVVMFAMAFPLLPLFSLINNLLEIRIDAVKYVHLFRRSIGKRRKGIGIWMKILVTLVKMSVFVNAILIAFTSTFLERAFYKFNYRSDLTGFVNFTLSVHQNSTGGICRYHGYFDQNGNYTLQYWKLMALRLLFVVIYEKIIFSVQKLIDVAIPDVPKDILIEMKRKKYLANTYYNRIWLEISEIGPK